MNKSIDWNAVTVGETEIFSPANEKWLIVCKHEGKVWLYANGVHYTREISSLEKWTIYDPWEEITDKCRFVKEEYTPASWHLMYGDLCIYHGSKKYKISEDGRRIWKRKEGDR